MTLFHTLPDGRRLAWCQSGEGASLIMLHGWSMSKGVFAEMARVQDAGFRSFLPDLPGHGESTPISELSLDSLADDLWLWLNEHAPKPWILCGWSLGGMVAMELARRWPDAVAGLVLMATTPRFTCTEDWPHGLPDVQVAAMQRNLKRRYLPTLGDFFSLMFAGEKITRMRLLEIREFAVTQGKIVDSETALAGLDLLRKQDQRSLLPSIKCPSLVIHGECDQISPFGAAGYLEAHLAECRLLSLADCGHAPFLSHPQTVARSIEEFASWCR
jgi:pimeloyl-[acyl-carrier protein] methyl ester esterase